jgi:hypothetical protein
MQPPCRALYHLDDEALEFLTRVALHPKKGSARPLGINIDHKGKGCEAWKADYSISRTSTRASRHIHLSEKARKAAHPFLALREAYVYVTSLPGDVDLTSPAHIEGRRDPVQRETVLKVIDGLIAKAGGAGSVSSSGATPPPAAAASTWLVPRMESNDEPAVAAAVESEPATMLPPSAVEVVAESSEPASAMADALKCSICLDMYDDPLSLSGCTHTFCRECITKHLQGRNAYSSQCPKCKKPAQKRDCLPNYDLAAVVQAAKRSAM